jgi:hypothetical protein
LSKERYFVDAVVVDYHLDQLVNNQQLSARKKLNEMNMILSKYIVVNIFNKISVTFEPKHIPQLERNLAERSVVKLPDV